MTTPTPPDADRIVAYRSHGGRILRCLAHIPTSAMDDFTPVASEDLPDGGICTYPDCGTDVLIDTPDDNEQHTAEPRPVSDAARTPCSIPECNADGSGEPCDRHETEQAHAAGEHCFCDVTCEAKFPTEHLRNFVVAKGYPGTAGALAELERRAHAAGLHEGAAALESDYPDVGIGSRESIRAARWLRARAGAIHQDGARP